MKAAIAAVLIAGASFAFLSQIEAGEYNYRRCNVGYYRPSYGKPQLYYFWRGNYYYYEGGNHGQLYYRDGDSFREYRDQYYERETIVLVPKAIEVEVHRDHYYSIDSASQQSLLADAIVGRMLLLMEKRAGGGVSGEKPAARRRGVGSDGTGASDGSGTEGTSAPPRMPRADEPSSLRAGAYQNAALLKAVKDSCVKCHGAASKQTRLITADGKLPDLPAGKVWECFGLVNTGEMPKNGEALPDPVVKLFYDWAKKARK